MKTLLMGSAFVVLGCVVVSASRGSVVAGTSLDLTVNLDESLAPTGLFDCYLVYIETPITAFRWSYVGDVTNGQEVLYADTSHTATSYTLLGLYNDPTGLTHVAAVMDGASYSSVAGQSFEAVYPSLDEPTVLSEIPSSYGSFQQTWSFGDDTLDGQYGVYGAKVGSSGIVVGFSGAAQIGTITASSVPSPAAASAFLLPLITRRRRR